MPTTDAQGRTISDDGNWWWDGTAWQPIKKSFLDTVGDAVDSAVKKVEGSGVVGAAPSPVTYTPAAAATPAEAAPAAATQPVSPLPAIPPADLLAYLGALRSAGVVTDAEFESIRRRIPGQA
ncbi:MAG TPA: hypothetical protein VNV65_00515 [Candidatus Solibacter sp.]|nr:hypothetical protein [Candidatus Solibacter sp.]